MKNNKNIDDLFKEQLSTFEATPSPEVWNHIQAKLKKDKEARKVIPIWWKLGGVAAVLALLLTISGVFKPTQSIDNNLVVEETTNKSELKNELLKENSQVTSSEKTENLITKEENASEGNSETTIIATPDNLKNKFETTVTSVKKYSTQENSKVNKSSISKSIIQDGVAVEDTKKLKEGSKTTYPLIKETISSEKNAVIKEAVSSTTKTKEAIAENKLDIKEELADPLNVTNAIVEEKNDTLEKDINEEGKKSIFDAIEEDKQTAVAKNNENKSNTYWEVTPNVGPVFYNSITNGSSISPSFADNPQSGDTNISYGVQVSYNVSDRLSVRTGINNVNLGYATGDVVLATSPSELALSSVRYESGGKTVLTAFDKGALENLPMDPNNPYSQINKKSTSGNAEVLQSISYYEVPMELKYALINNRFGINMIGGFSTLFLGNNEISVTDGDFRSVLGEANNLNTMSFSTNIGLGFDYKISNRFKFNIEPMFKYQLNPYNASVDFNPYYFGIYSGLSFKF